MTQSYTPRQIADGLLAGKFTRDSAFVPLAEVDNLYDQIHRWVDDRAKAQSQADRLREQNYELQRERDEARAEVERLHKAHQAACEGGDLLRAHNARLRAQVSEYFSERETHPVEET